MTSGYEAVSQYEHWLDTKTFTFTHIQGIFKCSPPQPDDFIEFVRHHDEAITVNSRKMTASCDNDHMVVTLNEEQLNILRAIDMFEQVANITRLGHNWITWN